MTDSTRSQRLLNVATVIMTVCALAVVGLRVRDTFFRPAASEANGLPIRTVADWHQYAVGTRVGPDTAPVTLVEFEDYRVRFVASPLVTCTTCAGGTVTA